MASLSAVSCQSQTKARSETRGSDRMTAPSAGLRFATSEAAAMMAPDKSALADGVKHLSSPLTITRHKRLH